jgi:hypothetical protein
VIFHEEHRRDDNIALANVLEAMLKTVGITAPFRGGMQRQMTTFTGVGSACEVRLCIIEGLNRNQ